MQLLFGGLGESGVLKGEEEGEEGEGEAEGRRGAATQCGRSEQEPGYGAEEGASARHKHASFDRLERPSMSGV